MTRQLYRTTVTVWTEDNMFGRSLYDLAYEADQGGGYSLGKECQLVSDPESHEEWNTDMAAFFAAIAPEDE